MVMIFDCFIFGQKERAILHLRIDTLCGTAEYLAPEIVNSKGHGRGADWCASQPDCRIRFFLRSMRAFTAWLQRALARPHFPAALPGRPLGLATPPRDVPSQVGARHRHLRNARRLPAILCGQSFRNLPENSPRAAALPGSLRHQPLRGHQARYGQPDPRPFAKWLDRPLAAGRPIEAHRLLEKR